jgi:sugar lactone lactonase YvrE
MIHPFFCAFTLALCFLCPYTLPGKPALEVILDSSRVKNPFGVTFDKKGNAYIAEYGGGRIHLLKTDGKLVLFSGNGEKGFAGDGMVAKKAVYNGMHNLARAASGDLYISDTRNNLIRKIDGKTSIISTIAGIPGKKGFAGDGGPAKKAHLADPISISLSPDDKTLLIADIQNKRIRGIDLATGIITTLAGNGKKGEPVEGGQATGQPLTDPRASVMDAKGNLYVLERGGNALRVVRRDGRIFTLAGTGRKGSKDGPARKAQFSGPKHLCLDRGDNVIIADDNNHLIRLYNPKTKTVSTLLGGDAIPKAKLNRPHGVAVAPDGALWICDSWNNRVLILRNYRE